MTVFLFTDRCLQRDWLLAHLAHLADALSRNLGLRDLGQLGGDLFIRCLTTELLEELTLNTRQPIQLLVHMHRNADRARLVSNRPGDRLANPPGCIGRELEALDVLKLLYGANEADVPLLDQIEEAHATADVLLCDRNDEAQVRLGQLFATAPAKLHDSSFTTTELAKCRVLRIPAALPQPVFSRCAHILP